MKTNLSKIFIAFLLIATTRLFAQGPPPPNGCDPFYALDPENDGFTEFNMSALYAYVAVDAMNDHNWDISGYTLVAYVTDTDRDLEINPIGETYINTEPFLQNVYIGFTYTGTGPEFEYPDLMSMTCWTLSTVASDADADFDGVPNSTEDLNGNGSLNDDNTDGDVLFNFQDNDDDNDGLLTIDEDDNQNGNPADDDTNANDIPDYLENSVILGLNNDSQSSFAVSPNPSRGTIFIAFEDNVNPAATLSIFDIGGKCIKTVVANAPTIEVTGLQSGVYLLKCESQNEVSVKKLIVLQ